jgi:hypothetical protein
MKNICILLLSFAFTQIVCAQNYNDSTSTGNVEVSKRKGTEPLIPQHYYKIFFLST